MGPRRGTQGVKWSLLKNFQDICGKQCFYGLFTLTFCFEPPGLLTTLQKQGLDRLATVS